jgi:LacI family transcriptional regulator
MATIKELAKKSGVSVATVSRVLNGYPDVSEATRERVQRIAAELDYQPSAAARTLVTKRSQLLGVVLHAGLAHPDLRHPFFGDVLEGFRYRVGELGYDVLLFANEEGVNGSGRYLRRSRHHRAEGIVLMGVDERDPEIQQLATSDIPCVGIDLALVGRRAGHVISDNAQGVRLALRHLHELGHTRIATITGDTASRPGAERLVAYREALVELGLAYEDQYVAVGDFYVETGRTRMHELLELGEPPTAVFAASDLMAVGAAKAAQERGLVVGKDVAIVGFDDIHIAPLVHPPLTTIRQDRLRLGAVAAESLVRMVEEKGAPPPVTTIPVELVVRESSGAGARARRRAGHARASA